MMSRRKDSPRGAGPRRMLWAAIALALIACAADAPHEGGRPSSSRLAQVDMGARRGSWVARATLAATPTRTRLKHADTKVSRQTSYTASIWARGSGKVRLEVTNESGRISLASVDITATSAWQQFTVPTFSSGDIDVARFTLYDVVGGAAGIVDFDDAQLAPVGGGNLLDNGGFELAEDKWIVDGVFSIALVGESRAPPVTPTVERARTGTGYAQAALSSSPSGTKLVHGALVAKSRKYTASIWARGAGMMELDVANKARSANLASMVIDATPTWQRYTLPSFDTGDNDVVHFLLYDTMYGGAGTMFFDDAFLGLASGPNILENPGFEAGATNWTVEVGRGDVFAIASGPPARPSQPDAGVSPDEPRPDPDGTYFAEVDANGTGCPKGTWNVRISSDGLVFTVTFSAYEVRLDPGMTQNVKDCQIAIRLHTPQGRSFSVQTFSYTGYGLLQAGVTGRQLATYAFQGEGVQSRAKRVELIGPYDDDFVFRDEVPIDDAIWSPCGLERELNITTRLVLQSERLGPSGYMNLTSADGSARMILRLASRSCSDFGGIR